MQIKQIMSRNVDGISADATLAEALQKFERSKGEPIPVYEGDRLAGMLVEHDVVHWTNQGGRDPRLTRVRQVMATETPYCYEDQDVEEAARLIRESHAPGMVVMSRNRNGTQVVGTLSPLNLAGSIQHEPKQLPTGSRIVPPSVLGLFGYFAAALVTGSFMAGWYGTPESPIYIFPFAAVLGGVIQLLAAVWAYRSDSLATAFHGTWGGFFLAYGLIQYLVTGGTVTVPTGAFPELGFWFLAMAAITWPIACVAFGTNIALGITLLSLAIAASMAAYSLFSGNFSWAPSATGWLLLISAMSAWYLATAMTFKSMWGRSVLPGASYQTAS